MKFVGRITSLLLGASLSLPSSIQAFQASSLPSSLSSSSRRSGSGFLDSRRAHQSAVEKLRLASTVTKKPGTAELDTPWEELGFEFRPTNSHVRISCKDGEWGEPELVKVRFFFLVIFSLRCHKTPNTKKGLKRCL